MLTISQLARYAGTTARAVRHYHAKGLLPEPQRDASGYRSYDAAAAVRLIRLRVLAEAGVPLSRVSELLEADAAQFRADIEQIDSRLRNEIRTLEQSRRRIRQLAAGDSLALPADVVAYLDRMHELGFPQRLIDIERDSWILIAAQLPEQVPALMAVKRTQIEHEQLRRLYLDIGELVDCGPDDPRLPALADRVAAFIEADAAQAAGTDPDMGQVIDDDLVALLDAAFVDWFPCAPRVLELLEERGWTGWTNIRRIEPRRATAARTAGT